jgi:O-antigen ligase
MARPEPIPNHSAAALDDATLASGLRDLVGPALFAAIMALIFVTLDPFPDRSGAALLGTQEGGAVANQILFPMIASALAWFTFQHRAWAFRALYHPVLPVVAAWLALTILTSGDPALSARRMLFNGVVILIAALMVPLPRRLGDFADILAGVAIVVLIGCWGGVVFLPERSIHWASDALETDLAGNWRGLFPHKNQTGGVMVLLVFIGLFYARVRNLPIGWAIAAMAALFLFFTKSKTSMALLPFILVLSLIVPRLRSIWSKAWLAFGLLALFNLATIGSSVPGPIRSVVHTVLPDASFTGRTDLWAFAIENIREKPVFGHGYGAFWRTDATANRDRLAVEPGEQDGWAAELGTDSHNGYLEVALSIGLPGLLIVLWWVMIVPLRDYQTVLRTPENDEMATLFLRIWLLGLYLASLESILLDRVGQNWFMLLVAIFGLRLLTRTQVVASAKA